MAEQEERAGDEGKSEQTATNAVETATATQQTVTAPQRPEALSADYDAFWDAKEGVKWDALTGELAGLRTFKAEVDVHRQGVPKKSDEYKVALPPSIEIPAGAEVKIDDSHPMAGPAREWAHKNGVSQEAFSELIGIQAQFELARSEEFETRAKEERQKLGKNGAERIAALQLALEGRLGKEVARALNPVIYTAASVEAVEKLLRITPASYQADRVNGQERTRADWGALTGEEKFMDKSKWKTSPQAAAGR